jgi:hypothetical protein
VKLALTIGLGIAAIGGGVWWHKTTSTPERQARVALQAWAASVERGESGKRFWMRPELADVPFSIRTVKVLHISVLDKDSVDITARVESSNRGGSPIVSDWTFFMSRQDNEWKIDILTTP